MARTWVLIRGLMRAKWHWNDFPNELQRHFPDDTIITPDLPGNGSLSHLKSPGSVHQMMLDIRAQVPENASQEVNVIAISLGAMMAIEWMHHFPSEINKAVLLNTSLNRLSPFYHRMHPRNYLSMARIAFSKNKLKKERGILKLTSSLSQAELIEISQRWAGHAERNQTTLLNAVQQIVAAARYKGPTSKPCTPILVLNGAKDTLVNPKCSEVIANDWDAVLRTHQSAGHDLPLDEPEWIVEQISDFFALDTVALDTVEESSRATA